MKLSARTRYATRILLELARHKNVSPMSAAILSQHTGVSVQFVEQILKPLKQRGLTCSIRGAAGGHKLARPAADVSLGEIVRLMEGGVFLTVCCGEKADDCPRKDGCLTRNAWVKVSGTLEKELDSISLEDLLHGGQICPEGTIVVKERKRTSVKTDDNEAETSVATTQTARVAPSKRKRVVIRKMKGTRR